MPGGILPIVVSAWRNFFQASGIWKDRDFKSIWKGTVEPRFKEPLFNDVLDITNENLRPGQNYSKMYGIEPRYNEHNPEAQT